MTLRPYAGQEYVKAIPFDVPRALAGQTVKVVVTAGNLAKPDVAPPENLTGLIDNLRKSYPARAIVVGLETPDEGVTLARQRHPRSARLGDRHAAAGRLDPARRHLQARRALRGADARHHAGQAGDHRFTSRTTPASNRHPTVTP